MNQENTGRKKLIALIILFLILIVGIGFFISWIFPSRTTPDDSGSAPIFSSFDRPTDRAIDVTGSETPYTYTPPPIPADPQPARNIERPVTAPESTFLAPDTTIRSTPSFDFPATQSEPSDTTTYPVQTYETYTPIHSAYYQPTYYAPSTSTTAGGGGGGGTNGGFAELDKQVFGYVTGLGWTQLLGDTGQQVFDILYALSPGGATAGTIGRFLPGAGGGGGSGGGFFGGGGSGGVMEFGGRVTRVTQCTCSAASMLDINDVRGQSLSLIYQPGASTLYSNYNVNGTGQNVLGNYTSGGACLVYHGEDCTAEGSPRGTITQIGTSVQ